jgi:hypothetical protein
MLAVMLVLSGVLVPSAAGADHTVAITVPASVKPGQEFTVSGPGIIACLSGSVTVGSGADELRFGERQNLTFNWSITSSTFTRFEVPTTIAPGTYPITIDCTDDRGNQSIHQTGATLTVLAPDPPPPPDPNSYQPLDPARLADTRPGQVTVDGQFAATGAVGPGGQLVVKVTGRGGVPATGAKAVVLNVTAVEPTGAGFFTVYPTGETRPLASNLNFAAGQTVPNLVVAKIGAEGQVTIYNAIGSTHVIVDVMGWFPTAAAFTPLTPARLYDSRPGQTTIDGVGAGAGAMGPGTVRTIKVTDRGGVPATDVGSVVLNVTVTGNSGPGFLTVYPTGEPRPLASNLNFTGGQTVANSVVAKVGANGQVTVYNDTSSTQVIVDVGGWFPTTSAYHGLTPARLLDTRPGQSTFDGGGAGGGPIGAGGVATVTVVGRAGVPAAGVGAVVLNVTATAPTAAGFLTVYPSGQSLPGTSNLNFAPGQTAANLVVAKVGADGKVSIFNATGSTHIIADVAGWFSH